MRAPSRAGIAVVVVILSACARFASSPAESPSTRAPDPSVTPAPIESAVPPSAGAAIDIDLEAIRAALIGPSPVPDGWADEVDGIMAMLENELADVRLPAIDGLAAEEAACATWSPLVGNQLWAAGAILERQVFIAHLAQLVGVAPVAIRPDAEEALRVTSTAAAEQLASDGDPAVISRVPRLELRTIGLWAVDHCELPSEADDAPDTTDWSEEDIAYSCELDRSLLERAMKDYRDQEGEYATHPHALEVLLESFAYPAWHRIASVDNDASPPAFTIEPIPGAFCDR